MSDTLEYKRICFGKLEIINDLEFFFKQSVEDYIDTCNQLNREMQKTYKGIFNMHISPELHKLVYQKMLKLICL